MRIRSLLYLIAARWLVLAFAGVPIAGLGAVALSEEVARRPYFVEESRTSAIAAARLPLALPPSLIVAGALGVAAAMILGALLTAGVLARRAQPERAGAGAEPLHAGASGGLASAGGPSPAAVAVGADGLLVTGARHLGAYARIGLVAAVALAAGAAALNAIFVRLDRASWHAGWTAYTAMVVLPFVQAVLLLLWFALVGAWSFWARVITATDGRRRVLRTAWMALSLLLKRPLSAGAMFVVPTAAVVIGSGALIVAWRQSNPASTAQVVGWIAIWSIALFVHASVWLFLIRAARALYGSQELASLRARPDAPFGVLGLLRRYVHRSRA